MLLNLLISTLSNSSFLLNISPPKLCCLQHVNREACLIGKFRLLVLVKLKRDCCWLGTDCLFRSLKYPNCSTLWKISQWSNASVVRPPQPTPPVTCAACTQAVHIFEAHENGLEHRPKDRHSGCTFTLSHMYHKHTVSHLCSNFPSGYSKKHIY